MEPYRSIDESFGYTPAIIGAFVEFLLLRLSSINLIGV